MNLVHHETAADLEWIKGMYTLQDTDGVRGFLSRNLFLKPFLEEMYAPMAEHFPESSFAVDVVSEPEYPPDQQLVVTIRAPRDPDEALMKFKQFHTGWWLEALTRAQGKLGIRVDFA